MQGQVYSLSRQKSKGMRSSDWVAVKMSKKYPAGSGGEDTIYPLCCGRQLHFSA